MTFMNGISNGHKWWNKKTIPKDSNKMKTEVLLLQFPLVRFHQIMWGQLKGGRAALKSTLIKKWIRQAIMRIVNS